MKASGRGKASPGRPAPEGWEAPRQIRPMNLFVNNYCEAFGNLKIEEDQHRLSDARPLGFRSDEALSRQLSYVLRHAATSEGFRMHPGGFIDVDSLLRHRRFSGKCTENDVKRVVAQDAKGRYHIRNDPHTGVLQIRANQGHTIEVKDDGTLLQKITREHGISEATHGTNPAAWISIQRKGLSRMRRNHIHMVPSGEVDLCNPHLPGLRRSALVLIVIDVHLAMFDGIEFFRSRNGVLLSPGDRNGFIGPKYFKRVINTKTGENMMDGLELGSQKAQGSRGRWHKREMPAPVLDKPAPNDELVVSI